MKLLLLLVLFVAIGELILAEETTTPPRAKNGTAAGHYRPSYNRHRHRDYDDDDYDRSYHRRRTPIIDDYVCDLEATILVVSSKHQRKGEKSYGGGYEQPPSYGNNNDYSPSGSYGPAAPPPPQYDSQYGNGPSYGGGSPSYGDDASYGSAGGYGAPKYENKPKGGYKHDRSKPDALRLKCSHIAINSEHDCHTCCQLSARHYRVSRGEIFGFIIDANEIKYDGKGYVRQKRSDNYAPAAPSPSYPSVPSPSYPSPSYPAAPAPSYPAAPAPSYPAPAYPGDSSYPAPAYSADQQYPAAPTPGYGSSDYQAATPSYGGQNEYYGPPKNARCVCCAPKHYRHGHRHHRRRYDDSDSDEY